MIKVIHVLERVILIIPFKVLIHDLKIIKYYKTKIHNQI